MSMKNPLTPAGIEPATFRIVAQHLNHCVTAVPITQVYGKTILNLIYSKMTQGNLNFIFLKGLLTTNLQLKKNINQGNKSDKM
jgi:hypothetical protein